MLSGYPQGSSSLLGIQRGHCYIDTYKPNIELSGLLLEFFLFFLANIILDRYND